MRVRQLADQADDRRRVDRAAVGLVVERDVAADNRHAELLARIGKSPGRAVKLPGDRRLLGIAEVEAVGEAERLGPDAGEVLRALEHGLDRAGVGIAADPAAAAVDRDSDRGARVGDLQHGGVIAAEQRHHDEHEGDGQRHVGDGRHAGFPEMIGTGLGGAEATDPAERGPE